MVNGVTWPLDLPRDSIHHDTPSAFPHIVPGYAVGRELPAQVYGRPKCDAVWLILLLKNLPVKINPY